MPWGNGSWTAPATQTLARRFRSFVLETGLMLRLRPMPTLWGFTAPRLGLSYRFAGEFSGIRFVIGETL